MRSTRVLDAPKASRRPSCGQGELSRRVESDVLNVPSVIMRIANLMSTVTRLLAEGASRSDTLVYLVQVIGTELSSLTPDAV